MRKIIVFLFFTLLFSCATAVKKHIIDGFAQGTTYHIVYHTNKGNIISKSEVDSLLNIFNSSCSLHDKNSVLSRLNANQTDTMDCHIKTCIDYAQRLHKISEKLYDITIKPLTSAYGFANTDKQETVNIDSILNFVGMEKIKIKNNKLIKLHPNVEIDLNSIAQGYSVDLIKNYLMSKGLTDFIVELGGEIYAKGNNNGIGGWRVGIDKPIDGSYISGENLQAIITIKDKGLATSGNYRKFYTNSNGERINHTINPITGKSNENSILSVTVLARNALEADGYSTMFMLIGKEKSIEYLNHSDEIEALIVYSKGDIIKTYITDGLKEIIKTN